MKEKPKGKTRKKAKGRIIALSLLAIFLLAAFLSRVIYKEYILRTPPVETDFSRSFARELFDFQGSDIDWIMAGSKRIEEVTGIWRLSSDDQKQLNEIAEHLNTFRYHFWIPGPRMKQLAQGPAKALNSLILIMKNGDSISFSYNKNRLLINRVWYYGDEAFFERLTELAEQNLYTTN